MDTDRSDYTETAQARAAGEPAGLVLPRILKGFWGPLLRVGVGLGLLIYIMIKAEPAKMFDALIHANPYYIAAAALLLPLNVGVQVFRWRFLVRRLKPRASWGECAKAVFAGQSLGIVTPGGIGTWSKSLGIAGCSRASLLGLAVLESWSSLAATYLLGLPAAGYFLWKKGAVSMLLALLALLVVGFLILFGGKFAGWISRRFSLSGRPGLFVSAFAAVSPLSLCGLMLIAFSFCAVFFVQSFLLVNAFAGFLPEHAAVGIPTMYLIKNSLPISFGDLGVRETASVFVFGKYGVPDYAAVNAGLLLFGINFVIPGLIGSFYVHRLRLRFR